MITINNWLTDNAKRFSDKIYLIDKNNKITYSENYRQIQQIMHRLRELPLNRNVVFIGTGSIDSYQLSFAVMLIQAIWVPVSYRIDKDRLNSILKQLNPSVIIYDSALFKLENINTDLNIKLIKLSSIFDDNVYVNYISNKTVADNNDDRIISLYLTSGSTGLPKIVQHGWYATLQHADATVKRYQFDSNSRLFNPRHLFHVSGAFALTTMMHCGGCIVIPPIASYEKSDQECLLDWANIMLEKNVTHVSFFPAEMKSYASLIDSYPKLNPGTLKRITTGGEEVEFADLVKVSRAFAANKVYYDILWNLYPYLGDGKLFTFSKMVFEYLYGNLVQVTQTYGATELICNAIANPPNTGPDTRGIGSVMGSLHPEIIDEQGMILPQDGLAIGRLRFFGTSVASGYLNLKDNTLSEHCYQTNDLASIDGGQIKLFGRYENLIKLPNEPLTVNPTILERELIKISGVNAAIIFKYNSMLHAAIQVKSNIPQSTIVGVLNRHQGFILITTISLWDSFPLSLAGKVDRKKVIADIEQAKKEILVVSKEKPFYSFVNMKPCNVI